MIPADSRLALAGPIRIHDLGNHALLFHVPSGLTLCVSAVAAAALRELLGRERSVSELMHRVGADPDVENPAAVREHLLALFDELAFLGIIAANPSATQ